MASLRNITRFEFGRTRGWWVRIRRRNRKVQAFFSDGKHGGRAAALAKARRQRDRWLRTLPAPIDPRRTKPSVRVYRDASSGPPRLARAHPLPGRRRRLDLALDRAATARARRAGCASAGARARVRASRAATAHSASGAADPLAVEAHAAPEVGDGDALVGAVREAQRLVADAEGQQPVDRVAEARVVTRVGAADHEVGRDDGVGIDRGDGARDAAEGGPVVRRDGARLRRRRPRWRSRPRPARRPTAAAHVLRARVSIVSPGRMRKFTIASASRGSTLLLTPPRTMVGAVVVRIIASRIGTSRETSGISGPHAATGSRARAGREADLGREVRDQCARRCRRRAPASAGASSATSAAARMPIALWRGGVEEWPPGARARRRTST